MKKPARNDPATAPPGLIATAVAVAAELFQVADALVRAQERQRPPDDLQVRILGRLALRLQLAASAERIPIDWVVVRRARRAIEQQEAA